MSLVKIKLCVVKPPRLQDHLKLKSYLNHLHSVCLLTVLDLPMCHVSSKVATRAVPASFTGSYNRTWMQQFY
jgi:hypothetical protein